MSQCHLAWALPAPLLPCRRVLEMRAGSTRGAPSSRTKTEWRCGHKAWAAARAFCAARKENSRSQPKMASRRVSTVLNRGRSGGAAASEAVLMSATALARQRKAEQFAAAIKQTVPSRAAAAAVAPVVPPAATATRVGLRSSQDWADKRGELYQPQAVLSSAEQFRQLRKLGGAAPLAAPLPEATTATATASSSASTGPANVAFWSVLATLVGTGAWLCRDISSAESQQLIQANVNKIERAISERWPAQGI